jgi:hypothetical protein
VRAQSWPQMSAPISDDVSNMLASR